MGSADVTSFEIHMSSELPCLSRQSNVLFFRRSRRHECEDNLAQLCSLFHLVPMLRCAASILFSISEFKELLKSVSIKSQCPCILWQARTPRLHILYEIATIFHSNYSFCTVLTSYPTTNVPCLESPHM